jgi:hypothetical protein
LQRRADSGDQNYTLLSELHGNAGEDSERPIVRLKEAP